MQHSCDQPEACDMCILLDFLRYAVCGCVSNKNSLRQYCMPANKFSYAFSLITITPYEASPCIELSGQDRTCERSFSLTQHETFLYC